MTSQPTTANAPLKIYLKDYTPPNFQVQDIKLDIRLYDDYATVSAVMQLSRVADGDLVLLGRDLQLLDISIDGHKISETDYRLDDEQLTMSAVPDAFSLSTLVKIIPQTNTMLEGLYQAGEGVDLMFVTQCEPEGFRKITYFPDRPDVLSVYTTRLEAPKRFPILLANGNLIDSGDVDGTDRHFAIWHDPTHKPSYLFAAVIADLAVMTDSYTTIENREVLLEIYAAPHDIDKCHVAMQALKDSMRWDEENYGRAYDLDRYMIVATGQFNMGAMENKGLNIFNTACVLSSPETTTDERSFRVKSVIAHEYFHNWTGNRITCRDWFQLCLKEGLTVFRDQSFSGDFRSKAVQRIDDVAVLRSMQFAEDAGTLAHPVRPESFVEINNFYTMTIYEKGAEIIRMLATIMGADKFRAGMDEYFHCHDGQAVTVEDFLAALATADERVLSFMPWYRQPGTPVLSGASSFDGQVLTLKLSQATRHVPGYDAPIALPIPVDTAVFDSVTGKCIASEMLILNKDSDSFSFNHLKLKDGAYPLVSVLRNFSAPVKLDFAQTDVDLELLIAYETEGFNRWQAVQTLVNRWLLKTSSIDDEAAAVRLTDALRTAVASLIDTDAMLAARLFDIPSQKELAMAYESDYQPVQVKARRDKLVKLMAQQLADDAARWYAALPITDYADTPLDNGRRQLRNVLLDILLHAGVSDAENLTYQQYHDAKCMSERQGALIAIVRHQLARKDEFLADFYDRFSDEALVIDSWFSVQAMADSVSVADIAVLMARADYHWDNPNRVRTTLGALSVKPVQLWTSEGMDLYLSAVARLDKSNPQIASRLLGSLARWYTLGDDAKRMVAAKLNQLRDHVTSKNVLEFLDNMLKTQSDV